MGGEAGGFQEEAEVYRGPGVRLSQYISDGFQRTPKVRNEGDYGFSGRAYRRAGLCRPSQDRVKEGALQKVFDAVERIVRWSTEKKFQFSEAKCILSFYSKVRERQVGERRRGFRLNFEPPLGVGHAERGLHVLALALDPWRVNLGLVSEEPGTRFPGLCEERHALLWSVLAALAGPFQSGCIH